MPIYKKIFLYKGMNKLVCLKTQINITSCSCDSRDCRDSRETLKYGSFGREKFGFRAMSRRIWKLCVASLLIILCFPEKQGGGGSSQIPLLFEKCSTAMCYVLPLAVFSAFADLTCVNFLSKTFQTSDCPERMHLLVQGLHILLFSILI